MENHKGAKQLAPLHPLEMNPKKEGPLSEMSIKQFQLCIQVN